MSEILNEIKEGFQHIEHALGIGEPAASAPAAAPPSVPSGEPEGAGAGAEPVSTSAQDVPSASSSSASISTSLSPLPIESGLRRLVAAVEKDARGISREIEDALIVAKAAL